jgi:hypothetical protein
MYLTKLHTMKMYGDRMYSPTHSEPRNLVDTLSGQLRHLAALSRWKNNYQHLNKDPLSWS